jgi:hypothetical protein
MQLAIVDHGHMLATHGVRNQPVAGKPKLAMASCWVADYGSEAGVVGKDRGSSHGENTRKTSGFTAV